MVLEDTATNVDVRVQRHVVDDILDLLKSSHRKLLGTLEPLSEARSPHADFSRSIPMNFWGQKELLGARSWN